MVLTVVLTVIIHAWDSILMWNPLPQVMLWLLAKVALKDQYPWLVSLPVPVCHDGYIVNTAFTGI